jgi:endonuclease/exonuclease/phosphatase family metal-dependent hydrolase
MKSQKDHDNKVMMGDMNALSRDDQYSLEMIEGFNDKQLEKFTIDGSPRYDAIDAVFASGYVDSAVHLKQNKESTVPTLSNKDVAHADLRLDYIFVSGRLASHLRTYRVIKNELTDKASDHFPVVVTLQ